MTTRSFQLIQKFDRGIQKFPDPKVKLIFKTPIRGSWLDRFTIYGTGYSVRSKEAMQEMYELLPILMGQKKWNRLGFEFVSRFPSRSTNLSELGLKFSDFLKREGYRKWAEVAAFERAIHKSFHAFRAETSMGVQAASTINEKSTFEFQSSTHLMKSKFDLVTAWQNRSHTPKLKRKKTFALIYRLGDVVCAEAIDQTQYSVLEKLKKGCQLSSAIRNLKDPLKLSGWLKYWIETEIIAGVQNPSRKSKNTARLKSD